ncbi:permease [Alkaliphilus metalliredigens QYMF]|uniref:Permease n=1 Tax=Alkaliphilus metalliredigens (strain QYMF) TaxID=293826 RepID=A6TP86_ALKMQ|nr:permease [Alkaliphilus metalliredigens]ABR48004.1 permease [Alkaliphilus metalliredigens QYMF]
MERFLEFIQSFIGLFGELLLLFIGITFLVGILQEYVKDETIKKILGKGKNGVGNIVGAFLGSLTPFCTCSTIPVMLGLLKAGVPFGITMSFFFASPLLNPIIIGLMWMLFGLNITIVYVAIIFPVSVMIGIVLEKFGYADSIKAVRIANEQQSACCEVEAEEGFWNIAKPRIRRSANYAMNLFRQMFPYLVLGSAIGAFIAGYVPEAFIVRIAGPDTLFSIPVASIIGIPMYIRGATILPIGSILVEQGMNMGAVMALIIGGAGASLPELTMLSSIFSRKLLITYIITVIGLAIFTGYLFNFLLRIGL